MDSEQQTQQVPSGRRPPARASGLVQLDLLPARYRRTRPSWSTIGAWLALIALLALLYPSAQWFAAANATFDRASSQLADAQGTLAAAGAPSGTEPAMQTQIASLHAQAQKLDEAGQSVVLQQVPWGETIDFALSLAPDGAVIDQIDQSQDTLTLTGTTLSYDQPLDYARRLEASGRFASVQVEIISHLVDSSPTPVPTSARSSRTPTPAPTQAITGLFGFRLTLTTRLSNLATPLPEVTVAP